MSATTLGLLAPGLLTVVAGEQGTQHERERGAWLPGATNRYRTTYAFLFNIVLVAAITDCLKVAIARPRPNWFYQCWPSGNITWQPGSQNAFGVSPPPWPRARTCVARRQRFIAGEVSLDARARRRACRCAPRASP